MKKPVRRQPQKKPRRLHLQNDLQMCQYIVENPDWLVGAD